MLRMHTNELLVFVAVVEAGSFVAGGRAMGLTRSAAAKAVARLEDRLGTRLLNRTTRALSLTDEGRVFHERGLAAIAAIDAAEASVGGGPGSPRGLLRLAVPDAFGRLVVFPLLRRYLASWPEVQAEVSFTDRRADLVEEGFDLAIRIGPASADSSLVSRIVARHRAMFVASPAYVAAHGEPADLDDVERHDCLVFSSRDRWRTLRYPGPDGAWISVPGRVRLRLDSAEAIRDAALAGLGIACLPDFLIAPDLAAGRLRRVLGEVAFGDLEIFAVYPSRRLLEPRVRRFIDLLVEELGA